jgi:hypothetical protein
MSGRPIAKVCFGRPGVQLVRTEAAGDRLINPGDLKQAGENVKDALALKK